MDVSFISKEIFWKYRKRRICRSQDKKFYKRMAYHAKKFPKLTHDQIAELEKMYAGYSIKITPVFHRFVAGINGKYSPLYIHPGIFYTRIEPALNDVRLAKAYADKNAYDMLFPNVRFPRTIGRCISGEFFDANYQSITIDKLMELIRSEGKVALKPALDSGGGNAVQLLKNTDNIDERLSPYIREGDFLVQHVADQHKEMKAFNGSSLNIVRMISLYLDGRVIVPTAALRVGAPGKFNDNFIDEKDRSMLTIGIDAATGKICSEAFFASGEKSATCLNGYDYHNRQIPSYGEMIEIVQKLHPRLPHFKMISWDLYVESDGHASVMELNLLWQGIAYYQYTTGPLFKDEILTRRVLDEVIRKEKRSNSIERL